MSRLTGSRNPPAAADILGLAPAIRAVVRSEGTRGGDTEDLVQETMTRLLEVRSRLDASTVGGYAVATARNLSRSRHRTDQLARRHQHRLLDRTQPVDPLAAVLSSEERDAVSRAVAAMPDAIRADLFSAARGDSRSRSEVTRRARVARARARARLEYVIALRRVDLPSARCGAVLLAISARDKRRQASLGAGQHLLDCPVCGALAEPLMQRQRVLAGLVPLPMLLWLTPGRKRTMQVAAALSVLAAVAVTSVLAAGHKHSRRATASAPAATPSQTRVPGQTGARPSGPIRSQAPVATRPGETDLALAATVTFAEGSDTLTPAAHKSLQDAAAALRAQRAVSVLVVGYTDSTGEEGLNQQLSLLRAQAVRTALQPLLGPAVRISCRGGGQAVPAASETSAANRARDRRAVVFAT